MDRHLSGTIRPAEFFDPEENAQKLIDLLSGPRVDLDKLIDIVCGCANTQRQQIRREVKKISGKVKTFRHAQGFFYSGFRGLYVGAGLYSKAC